MNTLRLRINFFVLLVTGATLALNAAPRLPQDTEALNTQLINAIRDGASSKAAAIISRGADPNAKDPAGTPALMVAALTADARMVQVLLEHGAKPNTPNAAGATALIWAAGDAAKVASLLAYGADVNARSQAGRTALLVAAGHDGAHDIVKMLLDKGADVNATDNLEGFVFTGGGGATPLIEAAKTRDLGTVRLLLDHGSNVNAVDKMGGTALTEASLRGSTEIAEFLIQRGADVNHRTNRFGYTPLILASMRPYPSTIRLLIASKADINAKDASGSTALMWAAYSDYMQTDPVRELLAAGGDPAIVNNFGETAATWAARRGQTSVVALLNGDAGAPAVQAAKFVNRDVKVNTENLKAAVARSLAVLDQGGPQFFKVSGCISCHNQTLPLVASAHARTAGVQPDEKIEQQQLKSVLATLKPATGILAENTDILPDIAVTGGYIAEMLTAQNYQPDALTEALVHNIAAHQMKDGSWVGWSPRPPIEIGDVQATANAVRAMTLYPIAGRKREFDEQIARARKWLRNFAPVTTEDKTMRLFGLYWAGASHEDIAAAADALLADQRADGGWGQLPTLPSDAYATGKVLTALKETTRVSIIGGPYLTGLQYLLQTQESDGSWIVKTRAYPFQPLKESGFPHGRDQWISSAGTAWASIALSYGAAPVKLVRR